MTEILPPQALLLEAAEQKQRLASDPAVSAWVRANAGTGKTHVLVQRILRLLLSGAAPSSILCLTFTKNAAAEMEARVLAKLGEWATASGDTLKTRLASLLARAPSSGELAAARCLFATVIDAPGGLPIMTIHGFCERVLRRYSFEANVPPGFAVLTEEEAQDALKAAMSATFAASAKGPLRDALTTVVAYASEIEFSRVLHAMLGQRNKIAHLLRISDAGDPVADISARLRDVFEVAAADTKDALIERSASVLDARTLRAIISALAAGSRTDLDSMTRFEAAARAEGPDPKRLAFKAAFTTKGGEARKSLMTAAVRKSAAALHGRLETAQAEFLALDERLCSFRVVEATTALLGLTAEIFERYEAEKRARVALDFDDLIQKTLSLLSRQDAADWVLYELDTRIDHILVDEAQDTSLEQWAIVEKLTSDFFSGQGARDCVPTLFAVGDEKQSIYGFQGAEPELLAYFGLHYEARVRDAGLSWCGVTLDLSFRTLDPVLQAVDCASRRLPGLQSDSLVQHLAYRSDAGGLVELWEPERGEKEVKGAVWDSGSDVPGEAKPAAALAERIAAQIEHWIASGEGLASCRRSIEPGDILILLRKREPMAKLLQAALRRRGVPVAGTDRMALPGELVVMDLLALADVLLQPEDDLALAAVLKSPLFSLSEDDLFRLAFRRDGSLWEALRHAARAGERTYSSAAEKLEAWRTLAARSSPLDFFAHVLEAEGGRDAFAKRLGTDCFDALDELLNLAESFGARPLASLAEFAAFARNSAAEVKRETDQSAREVRIMTVHGAKGLEANIVILADTCSNRSAAPAPVFFLNGESGTPPLPVWAIKGASGLAPIAATKDELKDAGERELGRLLYVAMTRARDRLYIAGFHNGSLPDGCWYATIKAALSPSLQEAQDHSGRTVWRNRPSETVTFPPPGPAGRKGMTVPPPLGTDVSKEVKLPILSPSKIGQWSASEVDAPGRISRIERKTAQSLGTLTHRLLEVLPALAANDRSKTAGIVASAYSDDLSPEQRQEAIERVLGILSNESLTGGWQPGLAEAGLGVTLTDTQGRMCAVILGQADRILRTESEITVVDYKLTAFSDSTDIARHHLAQLASYRLALERLYPGVGVRAALFDIHQGKLSAADSAPANAILDEIAGELSRF